MSFSVISYQKIIFFQILNTWHLINSACSCSLSHILLNFLWIEFIKMPIISIRYILGIAKTSLLCLYVEQQRCINLITLCNQVNTYNRRVISAPEIRLFRPDKPYLLDSSLITSFELDTENEGELTWPWRHLGVATDFNPQARISPTSDTDTNRISCKASFANELL